MKKVLKSTTALLVAASMLGACSTPGNLGKAASRALPPLESSAEAASFVWQPTINFQVQIHDGFDERGVLRPDGKPTWQESSFVAQISGRCAANIQDAVNNIGWIELRRTFRAGGALGLGGLIGGALGISNPTTAILKQVAVINAASGALANLDATDFQIALMLSSAHAQCTWERVKKEPLLVRVVIVITPLMEMKATPPQAPRSSSSGGTAQGGSQQAQGSDT